MSSLKRKRPHDAAPVQSPPKAVHRATRHTSNAPLIYKADPEPRRRRARRTGADAPDAQLEAEGDESDDGHEDQDGKLKPTSHGGRSHATAPAPAPASAHAGSAAPPTRPSATGRSAQRRPVLQATNQAHRDPALKPARSLRHRHGHAQHHEDDEDDENDDDEDQANTSRPVQPFHVESTADLRLRGSAAPPRPAQKHPPLPLPLPQQHQQQSQPQRTPSNAHSAGPMTQLPSRSARSADRVPANTSKPCLQSPTKSAQRTPKPAKKSQQHPSKEHKKPKTAERNIEKVVFGNICFSTWYHSPYGTEALGDVSGNSVKSGNSNGPSSQDGNVKDDGPANATSRKTKEDKLDRLYVCPCCFKYSRELVPWWQHVHQCERRAYIPGQKIYTHPKGQHARHAVPAGGTGSAPKATGRKRKAPETSPQSAEDPVEDQGEWSIWEVDGEEEGLFCQNLSLFAKLFLDNKSVFFDVVGFKYYLLVHTAPRAPRSPSPQGSADKGDEDEAAQALPLKHQIVGFFSKEKLSWDNNNLACILIFPPWQRKGLGALLMGVSYEISRREGVVGGPEKPISDLGKRGYKRFWAVEIASWLLGLDTTGDEEVVVDAEECSQATWIVPEDCLAVLREMGIVEEAGLGPPKPVRRGTQLGDGEGGEETAAVASGDTEKKVVPRVRISKEAVWEWVRANGISLEKACDPDGFVEGYAIKTESVEEEDEE